MGFFCPSSCHGEFNSAVVLTSSPLKDDQLFEVKITKVVEKWAGSIEIGVTVYNPETMQFPSTMTNLTTGTWMMSGNGVMHNGLLVRENFGRSLDSLSVSLFSSLNFY